jgi:glycosyl transferase family 11
MNIMRGLGIHRFLVFSDDLEWCRSQEWGPGARIIEPLGPIEQLAQTIACEHHVMANSTFSWWGAWLNPDPGKVVVAPSMWFGKKYQEEFDTRDLFPEGWVVV